MSLEVLEAGCCTSVQDLGRPGRRRFGITPGGVLDVPAAAIANILVGNRPEAPLLEMHFPPPRLRFRQATAIALGGADFSPLLDGRPLANWRRYTVQPGQILHFGRLRYGRWAYLAVAGGLVTPQWLGSAAMTPFASLDGLLGRRLQAGDTLSLRPYTSAALPTLALAATAQPAYARGVVRPIRVIPGPDFDHLTQADQGRFFTEAFTVGASSNRMATRLEGAQFHLVAPPALVSSAVACGVIQLPPDGYPTVLLADAQTVGGYPRVAAIITADLPDFVQRPLGAVVRFRPTTLVEAERTAADLRHRLAKLAAAVALTGAAQRG